MRKAAADSARFCRNIFLNELRLESEGPVFAERLDARRDEGLVDFRLRSNDADGLSAKPPGLACGSLLTAAAGMLGLTALAAPKSSPQDPRILSQALRLRIRARWRSAGLNSTAERATLSSVSSLKRLNRTMKDCASRCVEGFQ
jgi:hypothetical protein